LQTSIRCFPSGPERRRDPVKDPEVLLIVLQIADGAIGQVEDDIKLLLKLDVSDVGADKLGRQAAASRRLGDILNVSGRNVHAHHAESPLGEGEAVPPKAAGQIENSFRAIQVHRPNEKIDLFGRLFHPGHLFDIEGPDAPVPVRLDFVHLVLRSLQAGVPLARTAGAV